MTTMRMGRTGKCDHFTIGNVTAAACDSCGPLKLYETELVLDDRGGVMASYIVEV